MTTDHQFKDEWKFQRAMSGDPYPGNSVVGQPIAPDQPCFTCDVLFKDHPAHLCECECPDCDSAGPHPWHDIEPQP